MSEHERHIDQKTTHETQEAAKERAAELRRSSETNGEYDTEPDQRIEKKARSEAYEYARKQELERKGADRKTNEQDHQSLYATKKMREQSYKRTLATVQKQMSSPQRTFSKIIHHPTIEHASELASKTIARPNAILLGGICAFVSVTALYVLARYAGFSLSGFETIAAFALGWLIGLGYDLLRVMATGKD